MEAITLDVTKQLNQFNKLSGSMNFIISKAMNDVAFERGRKNLAKEVQTNLEIRKKTVANKSSIKVKRSNKKNLEVELYYQLGKDKESTINKWMGLQQFGGIETPKGKKLAIPIRENMARYANVPRKKNIPKSLRIDTIINRAPTLKEKDKKYRANGVYPVLGKRGVYIREDRWRMIYKFQDEAKHKKKLIDFQKEIERTYNINLERYIERDYLRILKG